MKGTEPDAIASTSASTAVPGDEGWVADGERKKRKEKTKHGKDKVQGTDEVQAVNGGPTEEDDDDAAWLRRRQAAATGNKGGTLGPDNAASVSDGQELKQPAYLYDHSPTNN